jgi:hypothetical protein
MTFPQILSIFLSMFCALAVAAMPWTRRCRVPVSPRTQRSPSNKGLTGTPSMVLVTRGRARPTVTLWPVPASTGTSLAYWRLRRIQDAGAGGTRTMDVPFRMLPPLVAGLAYYLALKVPGGMERRDALKAEYDEAWIAAADEDREKASTMLVPGLS